MKIIHCADIHLGSPLSSLPAEVAEERKGAVRASFAGMVDYAEKTGVGVILIAGDLFDSDRPLKKDKQFFYSVVRAHPAIAFFYLRGNHDGAQSYSEELPNLYTFSDEWKSYEVGDVLITGIERTPKNARSLYAGLRLPREKCNLVLLHGQAGEGGEVDLKELRGRGIDYLALGHLHTCRAERLDERGIYAYSGCLEGRGFDETGEKGFLLLDTARPVKAQFIPCSRRRFEEISIDVSDMDGAYEVYRAVVARSAARRDDLLRITLTGEASFGGQGEELTRLIGRDYFFVTVRDRTARKTDLGRLAEEVSLRGEFVRRVLADKDLKEEERREILALGLGALAGEDIE